MHICDESCVCPIHNTPMFYSQIKIEHACTDSTCPLAAGEFAYQDKLLTDMLMTRFKMSGE